MKELEGYTLLREFIYGMDYSLFDDNQKPIIEKDSKDIYNEIVDEYDHRLRQGEEQDDLFIGKVYKDGTFEIYTPTSDDHLRYNQASFIETIIEIAQSITENQEHILVKRHRELYGQVTAEYDLILEFATKFENQHLARQWDGEWIDKIDSFKDKIFEPVN